MLTRVPPASGVSTTSLHEDALTVARAYHAAWTTRNFQDAARRLADTLVVEVPINDYPTKAGFLRAVELTSEMATKIDALAEFGNASGALLLYDMQLPMTNLRVAELLRQRRQDYAHPSDS